MSESKVSFTVFRGNKSGKITKDTTTRTLGPNDAFVRVAHSGVCGTDEHMLEKGCVLGHEGVGYVESVGSLVKSVKKGDRVGFGYVHNVCGNCEWCLTGKYSHLLLNSTRLMKYQGLEQFCENRQMYGAADLDVGSFATHTVWKADMLIRIPEALDLKDAAPLMCAGATVWTALTTYGLKPGDRVGVQGIGGLGHLAIQFAAKLGAEVVVFSSSDSKKDEASKLGASEYFVLNDKLDYPKGKKLNHLLICGSGNPDYSKLIPLMAPDSAIYPLTVSDKPTEVLFHDLVMYGIRIQGSCVAARPHMRKMVEFAALHQIKPILMEWPMSESGIEGAMEKLRKGGMRYRAVLNV